MEKLGLIETQKAIKFIKDNFENKLVDKLNLVRVSAPLFVTKESGLNDNLNGYERSVQFEISHREVEIVQSLAKWKRDALARYGFKVGEGLYTDMNAIRQDESFDNLHSAYVDQRDWEKIIDVKNRNLKFLFKTVKEIYEVIFEIAEMMSDKYKFNYNLPNEIKFISTTELVEMYPNLSSKEREREVSKKYRAVFIFGIGWPLKNGKPHDGRAADYDDWHLNGDIILYDEAIDDSIELSSMGIRVDAKSLYNQLQSKGELRKLDLTYCLGIMNNTLPLTIGGGIGQSRLCMYYLQKKHICEVQASVWPKDMEKQLIEAGIDIL